MAEKTEKATPKKLRDARKKGQVAKSQDFPSAFTFATSIIGTLAAGSYLFKNLSNFIISTFRAINSDLDLEHRGGGFFAQALEVIFVTSFPIVLIVALVGVITNFLIIGPVFSFEVMKFNFKKLNPVEGIKQKFKLKVLVELLKSIFKISGAAIIIFLAIWNALPSVIVTARLPAISSALLLASFLRTITIQVGIFFLIIALFDIFFQKKTFAKEMMMEKFEIRQEFKDTEGDPHIKGRRKEMFREIAYSEGPAAASRARAIVTNPAHIAVAIGYEEGMVEDVPLILTMGQDIVAKQIIDVAEENNIPIMRNVELAHELYYKGNISDYIPKETYKAIAEVLKWVESLEEKPTLRPEFMK